MAQSAGSVADKKEGEAANDLLPFKNATIEAIPDHSGGGYAFLTQRIESDTSGCILKTDIRGAVERLTEPVSYLVQRCVFDDSH